ncbi:MAG: hypothetical protein FJ267_14240, partial [Planctomycetes bacterium]|nr:hypothetical protein [Planctomycetota bacterium]
MRRLYAKIRAAVIGSSLLFAVVFPFHLVRGDSWLPWKSSKSDSKSASASTDSRKSGAAHYGILSQAAAHPSSQKSPPAESSEKPHWWNRLNDRKNPDSKVAKKPSGKKPASKSKSQLATRDKKSKGLDSKRSSAAGSVSDSAKSEIARTTNPASLTQQVEFDDSPSPVTSKEVAQVAAESPTTPHSKLVESPAAREIASKSLNCQRSIDLPETKHRPKGSVRRIVFNESDVTGDGSVKSPLHRPTEHSVEEFTESDEGVYIPLDRKQKTPQVELTPSETDDESISLTVRDAPLAIVLSMIAEQHGLNLVAGGDIDGKVTVTLTDVALDEALSALLTVNGYSWHRNRNILVVSKIGSKNRTSPELQGLVLRVFRLNYIAAEDVEKVIQGLLSPAGYAVTTVVDAKNRRRTREE